MVSQLKNHSNNESMIVSTDGLEGIIQNLDLNSSTSATVTTNSSLPNPLNANGSSLPNPSASLPGSLGVSSAYLAM